MTTVTILPPILRDTRGLAFAAALDASLDIDPWLACPLAIEHAPDEVLWELSRQFDVAGPLYQAMRTRAHKERLVRNALMLQRKRGTPWSVEEVMRLLGFSDAKVLDRVNLLKYDGEAVHDGTYLFNAYFNNWREYKIRLYLDAGSRPFTETDREQAAMMAADWAPLRSVFVGWEARHIIESFVEDPTFEAARVYKVVLIDRLGNRQVVERGWTQLFKDNSVNIRWRVSQGGLTLSEVASVALAGRDNEEYFTRSVPIVIAAPNVAYEGLYHLAAGGG
jgi:biotin operon repressor